MTAQPDFRFQHADPNGSEIWHTIRPSKCRLALGTSAARDEADCGRLAFKLLWSLFPMPHATA